MAIRRAPSNQWAHITFNGAPGSILADPAVRVAIFKAIDRQGIATAIQNGMVQDPQPLDNHVYLRGQQGYQDNAPPSTPTPPTPNSTPSAGSATATCARRTGAQLEIRDVMYNSQTWVQIAQIIQQNLAQVGVKLTIDTRAGAGFFTDVIQPGDFDVTQYSYVGDPFPLSSLGQIYGYYPDKLQGNYGRIGSPELNDLDRAHPLGTRSGARRWRWPTRWTRPCSPRGIRCR